MSTIFGKPISEFANRLTVCYWLTAHIPNNDCT